MNEKEALMGGALTGTGRARPRGPRMLHIEELPGGFVVCSQTDYGDQGQRQVVPNVDALINAVNRWHRDGQRPEHD